MVNPDFVEQSGESNMTMRQKMSELLSTAGEDLTSTNLRGKATIIGLIAVGGYEWGPGNETVAPLIASQLLNLSDGIGGLALTSVVTGGFVYAQQRLSGYLARKTAENFPSVAQKSFSYVKDESGESRNTKFKDLKARDKFQTSFFLGASYNVLREAFLVGEHDKDKIKRISKKSSAINGITVASLGALLDTLDQATEDVPVIQTALDWTIKNPLAWLGLGCYMAYKYAKK